MDLNHGSSFYPNAEVRAAEVEDMMHCKSDSDYGRPGWKAR
ncbi:MAG: hypothetical protein U5L96_02880 [Owenweeksia sp.]|nr:hypothetical protein [Owenweeksia sp.]